MSPWLQFSPNSFPDILSPKPTPMLNFNRIRQHLQLVERERSTDADAAAERWLNHSTPMYIHTGDTMSKFYQMIRLIENSRMWMNDCISHK
jgi:hypothetical protein